MRPIIGKIKQYIKSYPRVVALLKTFEHTPRHVVHWYVLLLLGIFVSVVLVILAWVAFVGTSSSVETLLPGGSATASFNQEELQETLDTYRTQEKSFNALRRTIPTVIDPGR